MFQTCLNLFLNLAALKLGDSILSDMDIPRCGRGAPVSSVPAKSTCTTSLQNFCLLRLHPNVGTPLHACPGPSCSCCGALAQIAHSGSLHRAHLYF